MAILKIINFIHNNKHWVVLLSGEHLFLTKGGQYSSDRSTNTLQ